jgi:hypothetical protein
MNSLAINAARPGVRIGRRSAAAAPRGPRRPTCAVIHPVRFCGSPPVPRAVPRDHFLR